ncbi:Aste57867_5592 [Aphanomyces stellatus]|uniref:Aste57867_5592 protein n=1 Tax=Aphanomyces stellatus TaxID=120398 RepID=A0A485KFK8_9STRA|nr:hypothetical protein As57867_005579 [Aphanomyces stellatus]VFT82638.1 Aste57867_5592 [Aphanomyces stellatus]
MWDWTHFKNSWSKQMRATAAAIGCAFLASTHSAAASCPSESKADAVCEHLIPQCPDDYSPVIFNRCFHCAHDITCEIKSFAVVNMKDPNTHEASEPSSIYTSGDVALSRHSDEYATTTGNSWAVAGAGVVLSVGVALAAFHRYRRNNGYHSILSQQSPEHDVDENDNINPFCQGRSDGTLPSLLPLKGPTPKPNSRILIALPPMLPINRAPESTLSMAAC